jgi:hypothetical protein
LKNLLKTWSILVPQELSIKGNNEYILERTKDWDIYPEYISLYDSFLNEAYSLDTLQGYLQRCIRSRKWGLNIRESEDDELNWFVDVTINIYDKNKENPTFHICFGNGEIAEALLTVYLMALAAQRPLKCGTWKHFKGGTYFVKATAKWSGQRIDSQSFASSYLVEEEPSIKLQLILDPKDETKWIYNASKDYGDRVFYSDKSGLWARKTEIFLSLVKPNHEYEGVLRFVEVDHADAA